MTRSFVKPAAALLMLLGAAGCAYTSTPAPVQTAAPSAVLVTPAPSTAVVVPGTVVRTY